MQGFTVVDPRRPGRVDRRSMLCLAGALLAGGAAAGRQVRAASETGAGAGSTAVVSTGASVVVVLPPVAVELKVGKSLRRMIDVGSELFSSRFTALGVPSTLKRTPVMPGSSVAVNTSCATASRRCVPSMAFRLDRSMSSTSPSWMALRILTVGGMNDTRSACAETGGLLTRRSSTVRGRSRGSVGLAMAALCPTRFSVASWERTM